MVMRISGFASGLDIDQIVSDLMKAERIPLTRLEQQRQLVQWQREAYLAVNSQLLKLRNAAFDLKLSSALNLKQIDITGNAGAVSAKATGGAIDGVITVEVKQVATAARTISDTLSWITDPVNDPNKPLAELKDSNNNALWTGTYSITINGVTITGDAGTDSLNTLLHKINTSSAGVTAYYDAANKKISFTAKEAGWVNGPNRDGATITFDDGGSGFLGTVLGVDRINENLKNDAVTAAQKAVVTINGLESEQNTNTLTVNGITITLKAVGTATLTVRTDVDAVVAKIKAFVDTYNETLSLFQTKLTEKRYRDYLPLTEEQKKEMTEEQIKLWEEKARSGLLRGDSVLQALEQSLRSIATAVYNTGSSAVNSLASIGIRSLSYQDNGKLYVDEAKLRQAIETDIEAVKKLFQQNGATEAEKGIAVRLYDRVAQAMKEVTRKAGSDPNVLDSSVLGWQLRDLNARISAWEQKLIDIENKYYRQFTAMEQAISRYNMQAMFLAQRFGGGAQG
ncbi:flagellar hook-associated protein 2 [Calditerricola satsumensis]|uniref:Flagellar hook-associated protein 2 n=1 Tax=Calditerricola satsumensis TaxID=373054 RepID=A0A8J3BB40_9BACI|nr:flagellar hook-associated protein 2 [Calditerricola satsumensis]GGJ94586.1 flagellar hook-associated protein 2 [Calditerricola satsumensis]